MQATALAQQVLGYFQGPLKDWTVADQAQLQSIMPEDRRYTYDIRKLISVLADSDSFLELQPNYGKTIITGFVRIEGHPCGLIANDNKVLGGAVDALSAAKAARFLTLCSNFSLPVVSLCDTPGFMVGPDSEEEGAARKMAELFTAGANLKSPLVCIFVRKAYGLGAELSPPRRCVRSTTPCDDFSKKHGGCLALCLSHRVWAQRARQTRERDLCRWGVGRGGCRV